MVQDLFTLFCALAVIYVSASVGGGLLTNHNTVAISESTGKIVKLHSQNASTDLNEIIEALLDTTSSRPFSTRNSLDAFDPLKTFSTSETKDTSTTPAYHSIESEEESALRSGTVVNILCRPSPTLPLQNTSGSGVIIGENGLVLSVAHVAHFYLWKDVGFENSGSCVIRTGSPAVDTYTAELVYLPHKWLTTNADIALTKGATGNGQYDFALLVITGRVDGNPLPKNFPYSPLSYTKPTKGLSATMSAYGAEFLSSSQILDSLSRTEVKGSIEEVFSFSGFSVDVVSVNGGVVAQQGSSGGGVFNSDGKLIALITSRSGEDNAVLRSLQAITVHHIEDTIQRETTESLDFYLTSSQQTLVHSFETEKKAYVSVLENILK
jgi:hypothetical protein